LHDALEALRPLVLAIALEPFIFHQAAAQRSRRLLIAIRRCAPENRFAADSLLEESGFEPLVPLTLNPTNAGERDEKKRSSSWQIEARTSPRSQWLAPDSPLEGDGFELPIPRAIGSVSRFGKE
jgi:hypothetical protein